MAQYLTELVFQMVPPIVSDILFQKGLNCFFCLFEQKSSIPSAYQMQQDWTQLFNSILNEVLVCW